MSKKWTFSITRMSINGKVDIGEKSGHVHLKVDIWTPYHTGLAFEDFWRNYRRPNFHIDFTQYLQ